jgi:TfoX/Sxy family transcriptional regulator of competence genes
MDADTLVAGVRSALAGTGRVREVRMFGGVGFMLNGNLVAAASPRGLLLRVGKAGQAAAVRRGARVMVMRGRPMADYVYVDPPGLSRRAIAPWLRLATAFVATLAPKPAGARRRRTPQATARRRRTKETRP